MDLVGRHLKSISVWLKDDGQCWGEQWVWYKLLCLPQRGCRRGRLWSHTGVRGWAGQRWRLSCACLCPQIENASEVLITPLEKFRKEQIGAAKVSCCCCTGLLPAPGQCPGLLVMAVGVPRPWCTAAAGHRHCRRWFAAAGWTRQ